MSQTISGPVPSFKLSDGKSIPTIGWGNGTGGDAKAKAVQIGKQAISAGLRHLDTAQGYNNEVETGETVKQCGLSRGDLWVTSKLSQENGDPTNPPIPTTAVRASVNATIQRLGFHPDLLLVHNPFVPEAGQIVPFWQVLEDMKDKGELTSSLGISNFHETHLRELLEHAKYKPVCHQIEYHPYVLQHIQPILDLQEQNGIITESYGPLSPLLRHKTGGPLKPILERIAHRLKSVTGRDVDEAAVLLLWCRAKKVVAVTTSANEERIAKLAQVQQLPDLEQSEVEEIESVGRKIHFRAYDEHMKFPAPDLPEDL